MKSAYEIAMARLEAQAPGARLTDGQKERIAAIETKCKADIAAKELLLQREMEKAIATGEHGEAEKLRQQLSSEIRRLEEKRDREKDTVRAENSDSVD